MKTTVSARFQTVIPTELRKKFNIKANSKLEWIDGGKVMIVVSVPADPIGAVRGMFKGKGLANALIESRQEERRLEEKGGPD
ncbi:MAG: AbrB/MazE/SpoVT family DNA-binding domain-containing protein [Nitrospinae bacterium]|nr:AbrB/MazE/SpoVT family DNA-binding domain-containing protein [Nitrospinota bacterium]